jgi:hypothetical protein
MKVVSLLVIAASSSKPESVPAPATSETAKAIEHEERCQGARAIWRGERTAYDVYRTFSLEVAGVPRPWTRELDGSDGDKPFKLFSPDCKRILLLQTELGPFHIVRVDRLDKYLAGEPPDHVLAGEVDPSVASGTGVFRRGVWLSNTEVAYTWGCCEPPITTKFTLPDTRTP